MARILDPEGRYSPEHPVFQPGEPIDASKLPRTGVDPYADVDVTRLDQAHTMSVPELVRMGQIAESRGKATLAMEWKVAAQNTIAQSMVSEDAARLEGMAAPQHRVNPGKGIVAPTLETPWGSDGDWLDINAALTKATADDGWKEDTEARANVANLQSMLREREQVVRTEAVEKGIWGEQEEGTFVAKQSLAEKAAAVTEQTK